MKPDVVETIDNLQDLKAYACRSATGKEWYWHCVECKSVDGCHVGCRVTELLERQTSNIRPYSLQQRKEAKKDYESALSTPDPIGFVAITRNISRSHASNCLNRWKKAYPDIAKKYQHTDQRKYNSGRWAGAISHETACERIRRIFATENPLEAVMKMYNQPRNKARDYMYRWIKRYPDLSEELHIREYLVKSAKSPNYAHFKKEDVSVSKPIEMIEEDEMSVSDFLDENSDVSEEEPEVFDCLKSPSYDEENVLLIAVRKKQEEIRKRISELETEISTLKTQISTLNGTYYILTGNVPE